MPRVLATVLLPTVFAVVLMPAAAAADPILFSTRASFTAAFERTIVDDYSDPGYTAGDISNHPEVDVHSNAHMSAVLGETRYETTGHPDTNIIFGQTENTAYCAGCNGSFLLTFDQTSLGNANGVRGVAFNFDNPVPSQLYGLLVTFGDGSVQQFALPFASTGFARDTPGFFGIAASELIRSIHFGPNGGEISNGGSFAIDNLTLGGGAVAATPEPGTLLLVAAGALAAARRRMARRSPM